MSNPKLASSAELNQVCDQSNSFAALRHRSLNFQNSAPNLTSFFLIGKFFDFLQFGCLATTCLL